MRNIFLLLATAAIVAIGLITEAVGTSSDRAVAAPTYMIENSSTDIPRDASGRTLYIIGLSEAPVVRYRGELRGFAAIPHKQDFRAGVDVKSTEARVYADHLSAVHDQVLNDASTLLGRPVTALYEYRYAYNGFSAWFSASEAKELKRISGVTHVERYRTYDLNTDVGPNLIGASQLWWGSTSGRIDTVFVGGFETVPAGNRGEGVVVGDIDSGTNFDSPANSATDEAGFTINNPLGTGHYLGWCNPGYAAQDPCNDKVIGSWDFSYPQVHSDTNANEPPGSEDEGGHGSHTSSTAMGNTRLANYNGLPIEISGVAPHANLIIYDACYTRISDGRGLCGNVATTNGAEQAVIDGVVDVINYSISGGVQPWTDATSQAFLSAMDAGILVSASAGNGTAPVASGTTNHYEPWVATVAASTHARAGFANTLVTPTGNYLLNYGSGSPTLSASIVDTTPIVVSPQFNATTTTGTDGCAAYPGGTFTASIALVSRGTCTFVTKVTNATAAGAIAVVIANNRAGSAPLTNIAVSPPTPTVPVWGLDQTAALALQTYYAGGSSTHTAGITHPQTPYAGTPDVLADFSLLGPASINVLKPDIDAPGVNILASLNGVASSVGLLSGTSMAAPHVAGSAALVKSAHPHWTPSEIKSALMMTATTAGVLKANGTTPADPFDVGAGRVQVNLGANAGLILNETTANYQNANPATGGDPRTLNLPSIYDSACASSCSFDRQLKNALGTAQLWNVSVTMGGTGVSVGTTPLSFTTSTSPGVLQNLHIVADTSTATSSGWRFGQLTLTPAGSPSVPTLHMPIAINVPPAQIRVTPNPINITVGAGLAGTTDAVVHNDGGLVLNWTIPTTGSTVTVDAFNQPSQASDGLPSTQWNNPRGLYNADDFTFSTAATLSKITANGFVYGSSSTLATLAQSITIKVYSDVGSVPAGNPEGGIGGEVYSCTRTTGGASSTGLTIGAPSSTIALDIVAAAAAGVSPCPAAPVLTAGARYWVAVYPTFATTAFSGGGPGWAWFITTQPTGVVAQAIGPTFTGLETWQPSSDVFADPGADGLALKIRASFTCGASWLSETVTGAAVYPGSSQTTTLHINTTGLTAGTYAANLCVNSDDPVQPSVVVPVNLTVVP